MTPELYEEVRSFEGQAMRMIDRIRYHIQEDYLFPSHTPEYTDTFQARADLVFRHSLFWDYILRKYEFDAVISQNFSHLGWDLPLWYYCKSRGIPTLILHDVGQFPGLQYIQESVEHLGKLNLGGSLKSLCSSRLYPETPDRATQHLGRLQGTMSATDPFHGRMPVAQGRQFKTSIFSSFLTGGNVRAQIRNGWDIFRAVRAKIRRLVLQPKRTTRGFLRTVTRMRMTRRSMREEQRHWSPPPTSRPFVYLPLHFQPEASTSAKGRQFVDQREAVAMVAASLPPDWLLVVKEHPHQWRRLYERAPHYWSRIAVIPRVKVAPHTYSNDELISNCQGVVSISHSTVATEAWARGKRVAFLGYSHLSEAPGVTCPDSLQALRNLWNEPYLPPSREAMVTYLKRVEDSTFEAALYGTPGHLNDAEARVVIDRTRHNVTELILAWLSTKELCSYP